MGILVCLLVAGYSIWNTSAGKFPDFQNIDKCNYYIDLGGAFLHGQIVMLQKPNPNLIALKKLYSYKQRTQIPYQFDNSYYQGKYYL